ncbi:hypothetical protein AURDEDRAFT_117585 [Auricularia subglabra TFB-10046 SS5]|uniref:Uncharacterized protein n=1 Tax=Auricularia subglabra (strain TFB-10046 / SS5) TaxID=717982 RepID=J0CW28_AURST|nr:hypothetical protein AURDEDRAFT_117585 [Auricularia subglabra TFB-10046 SS5]
MAAAPHRPRSPKRPQGAVLHAQERDAEPRSVRTPPIGTHGRAQITRRQNARRSAGAMLGPRSRTHDPALAPLPQPARADALARRDLRRRLYRPHEAAH